MKLEISVKTCKIPNEIDGVINKATFLRQMLSTKREEIKLNDRKRTYNFAVARKLLSRALTRFGSFYLQQIRTTSTQSTNRTVLPLLETQRFCAKVWPEIRIRSVENLSCERFQDV